MRKNQQVHTYAVIFSLKSSQTLEKKNGGEKNKRAQYKQTDMAAAH